MPAPFVLDLHFQGHKSSIAAFLIKARTDKSSDILIETGPASTIPTLSQALQAVGSSLGAIGHVFLTHIHFDHAGAAWALAQRGARIYVHPVGLPHLADPSKLLASATRIYGADMDRLWGPIHAIATDQLIAAEDHQCFEISGHTLTAHHTPGHASHHIAWQWEDTFFCGDAAGVAINNGPPLAPCPPPDLNIKQWQATLLLLQLHLERAHMRRLALTHFGIIESNPQKNNPPKNNLVAHLEHVQQNLLDTLSWMQQNMPQYASLEQLQEAFTQHTQALLHAAGATPETIDAYLLANPPFMSVLGFRRYLKQANAGP